LKKEKGDRRRALFGVWQREAMDVTRDNLEEALPVIREAIASCEFMAMDFELSGLFPRGLAPPAAFDTVQERYESASLCARTFIPVQFGLSTNRWDEATHSYHVRSFNFYIHPRVGKKGSCFLSDLASLQFLSSNHFNFNKLFAEGIPFFSREKEATQEEQAAEEAAIREAEGERPEMALAERDLPFIEETMAKIETWRATEEQSLTLPPCNTYLVRVLYQEVPKRFSGLTLSRASIDGSKWPTITITRISEEDRAESVKKAEEERLRKKEQSRGFLRVVELMCAAKKPLLGHNMLLDLCYFYQHFLGSLPETATEFGENLLAEFPM
jgi:poly(A)-specific ribonuclease